MCDCIKYVLYNLNGKIATNRKKNKSAKNICRIFIFVTMKTHVFFSFSFFSQEEPKETIEGSPPSSGEETSRPPVAKKQKSGTDEKGGADANTGSCDPPERAEETLEVIKAPPIIRRNQTPGQAIDGVMIIKCIYCPR